MGVSTDAILAFGFDLGDNDEIHIAERFGVTDSEAQADFDFDGWVAEKAGAIYPAGHSGIDSPEYKVFAAARDAAINACPVELVIHCSYDYPMYFLALRGTKVRAWRGSPVQVQTPTPSGHPLTAMRQFCAHHGIAWEEPQWHIFSLWG